MLFHRIFITTLICVSTVMPTTSIETWEFYNKTTEPAIPFQESAFQIYMIKRFSKAVELIKKIHKKRIFSKFCNQQSKEKCPFLSESMEFKNKKIILCRNAINKEKSLHPFLTLWDTVKRGGADVNAELLHEYSIIILEIYKVIFTACSPIFQMELQKGLVLQAISMLGGNIATLHAFEILRMIDKLTEKIPKLLEKYELNSKDLSWKMWLKKYWWLPPIAAMAIAFESVFLYQIAIGQQKVPKLKRALGFIQNKIKNPKEAPREIII